MTSDARTRARRVAERAARESYGRLVAILARRAGGDLSAAEDALSEAFRLALRAWPETGAPENAEAWLIRTARRELGRRWRGGVRQTQIAAELALLHHQEAAGDGHARDAVPDERLSLMLVCAHPAIDASIQGPLMLQTVLGVEAAQIAACYLTSPEAMGRRLARAKSKIRDAGVPFERPEPDQVAARMASAMDAIYVAFGIGWDDVIAGDARRKGLSEEAIWLTRVLVSVAPDAPEARGLLALMLHCEARRAARRDGDDRFVPLDRQDWRLWNAEMIVEAEAILFSAARARTPGRYQVEAAIQSVHAQRARTGAVNWPALRLLYDLLVSLAPSAGARIARAAVVAEAGDCALALQLLDDVATPAEYQPFWATRARILE